MVLLADMGGGKKQNINRSDFGNGSFGREALLGRACVYKAGSLSSLNRVISLLLIEFSSLTYTST
jgi:hypothetical protein